MNDDELLARLRVADPALTSRAPLSDVNCLVEAALNTDTAPQSANNTAGITHHPAKAITGRRRRLVFGLAAAAGLLMVGGAVTGGIMANSDNGDKGDKPTAGPLTLTTAAGSGRAKCAEPVPDKLRKYPTLFEGTVTSVKGSSVTFRVGYWLKGGGTGTVVLNSAAGQPETLTFMKGERYIVAADKDGVVPQCGANMASEETVSKFRQAYGK